MNNRDDDDEEDDEEKDDEEDDDEEEQDEEINEAREEFMDMCLQLARNDPSVVDLNDWHHQGNHFRLLLNDADITLLGKSLVGNTCLKVLAVVLSNATAVSAENCLRHGIAKSQLESMRLARTSRRFQTRLFDSCDNHGTSGLPLTLQNLDCFESIADARAIAKCLFPMAPADRPLNDSQIGHHPQLLTLSLDTCSLDDTDMLTLSLALAQNRSLHTLRVTKNFVTNIGITYFCQNWSKDSPLRELNLYHNRIGANGAVLLLQTVAQRPALELLLLTGNALIGHAGLQRMGAQLPLLGSLKHLDMNKCVLTPASDTKCSKESKDAARALANGLRGNTSLEVLCIGANNFGSLGAKLIMLAVAAHPKLSQLSIAFDQSIGLKGLKHIGNILPNTRLTALQVDDAITPWPRPQTKLAMEAGQALLQGVQNCPHLLIFAYDALAPMWLAPIQLFLNLNASCRPLFSSEIITSGVWPHVLARYGSLGKNNHLYFCLREQPWLIVARPREE